MSARFTRNDAAKQHQGVTHQAHRGQHMRLRGLIVANPEFFVVLPLCQRQLQSGFQPVFHAGFRGCFQHRSRFDLAWRIPLRQMISTRRFTQAALAQTRLVHQLIRQLQNRPGVAAQQFKLQLANRLRQFTCFHFA
ncbi:hypothetical protein SDC9_114835 [bioreactor metagenome]|uniref:Uncharacterized protein n=1 Tax=bioreactor metagenome TaxID=1076179 RepID=A0A645BR45_9ZZZZ